MNISLAEKAIVSEGLADSNNTSEDGHGPDIANHPAFTRRNAERKLVRKCDLHVIPILAILYSLAFVDRINIGNARLQGLEKDLSMKGQDYSISLFIFFIPYILAEVPSNILIRKFAPSTWLSSIMVLWGDLS